MMTTTIEQRVSRCERSARRWRAGAIFLAAGWMIAAGHRGADDLTVRNLTVTDSLVVGQTTAAHIRMKPKAISGGEGASVEIWGLPFEDGVFLEAIPKAGSVIAWSGGAVTTLVAHAANGEDGARSAVTASMDDSVVTIMASTSVSVVDIEKGDKSKRILP